MFYGWETQIKEIKGFAQDSGLLAPDLENASGPSVQCVSHGSLGPSPHRKGLLPAPWGCFTRDFGELSVHLSLSEKKTTTKTVLPKSSLPSQIIIIDKKADV